MCAERPKTAGGRERKVKRFQQLGFSNRWGRRFLGGELA